MDSILAPGHFIPKSERDFPAAAPGPWPWWQRYCRARPSHPPCPARRHSGLRDLFPSRAFLPTAPDLRPLRPWRRLSLAPSPTAVAVSRHVYGFNLNEALLISCLRSCQSEKFLCWRREARRPQLSSSATQHAASFPAAPYHWHRCVAGPRCHARRPHSSPLPTRPWAFQGTRASLFTTDVMSPSE